MASGISLCSFVMNLAPDPHPNNGNAQICSEFKSRTTRDRAEIAYDVRMQRMRQDIVTAYPWNAAGTLSRFTEPRIARISAKT